MRRFTRYLTTTLAVLLLYVVLSPISIGDVVASVLLVAWFHVFRSVEQAGTLDESGQERGEPRWALRFGIFLGRQTIRIRHWTLTLVDLFFLFPLAVCVVVVLIQGW